MPSPVPEAVATGTLNDERPDAALRRWAVVVGAGVFATTLAQPAVLRLPFQVLLKSELHVAPETMAAFFALAPLAWYFKPFAGILSDSVPLFGTRRRHYLLLSAVAAGALWLLTGWVPRTYVSVLLAVAAMNAMLVIGSTVVGGIMVEAGQRYQATGRLTSARYFVQNVCVLVGGPLGGWLAARRFELTAVTGAVIAASVVPVAWWLLREPPVARRSSDAWTRTKADLTALLHPGPLWAAAGLLLLVYIAPGFQTPLFYYQTDRLGFSPEFIGALALIGGGTGLLGAVLYGALCERVTLRWLLAGAIALNAAGTLGYLFYGSRLAASIVEGQAGLLVTLSELALMDLAARATPRGSEALGFAVMMSVRNGALGASDVFGSWLIGGHHVSFPSLVWLNAGTTALVLVVIPWLPAILLDRRDAGAERR